MTNRRVTPVRRTNNSIGKPLKVPSALRPPRRVPTRKAATKPITPRLIGQIVATTNMTTSTIIEMISGLIEYPYHIGGIMTLRRRLSVVVDVEIRSRAHPDKLLL